MTKNSEPISNRADLDQKRAFKAYNCAGIITCRQFFVGRYEVAPQLR